MLFGLRLLQSLLIFASILKIVEYYSIYDTFGQVIDSNLRGLLALIFLLNMIVSPVIIYKERRNHHGTTEAYRENMKNEGTITFIYIIGVATIYYALW